MIPVGYPCRRKRVVRELEIRQRDVRGLWQSPRHVVKRVLCPDALPFAFPRPLLPPPERAPKAKHVVAVSSTDLFNVRELLLPCTNKIRLILLMSLSQILPPIIGSRNVADLVHAHPRPDLRAHEQVVTGVAEPGARRAWLMHYTACVGPRGRRHMCPRCLGATSSVILLFVDGDGTGASFSLMTVRGSTVDALDVRAVYGPAGGGADDVICVTVGWDW